MSRKQSKRARFYAISRAHRHFVHDFKVKSAQAREPLGMTPERARLIQVAIFIWAVRLDDNPTLAEAAEYVCHSLAEVREAIRIAPRMNGAVLEIFGEDQEHLDAYYCDPTREGV